MRMLYIIVQHNKIRRCLGTGCFLDKIACNISQLLCHIAQPPVPKVEFQPLDQMFHGFTVKCNSAFEQTDGLVCVTCLSDGLTCVWELRRHDEVVWRTCVKTPVTMHTFRMAAVK